jgi:DNA repair protein RecO (recombination protein O)
VLQPFVPLLVSFTGRAEMKTLTAAEVAGAPYGLRAEAVFSGLYLNELLMRLLHRHDAHPALFARYGDTLQALATGESADAALRRFELKLLDELGYSFDLASDATSGAPLSPESWYRYETERGLVATSGTQRAEIPVFLGEDLLAMARDDFSGSAGRAAKRLLRQALAAHLGDRPLLSRNLFPRKGSGTVVSVEEQDVEREGADR